MAAGDWIKWCKGLSRKREILMMAKLLNLSRREVASALMELWEWCDDNVGEPDINADGDAIVMVGALQPDTIDEIVDVPGLAAALIKVEWMEAAEGRWIFPNFGRHNTQTSKARALNANRVSRHRNNDRTGCNGASVTDVTPGELPEKRREENTENTPYTPTGGEDASGSRQQEESPAPTSTTTGDANASQSSPSPFERFWAAWPEARREAHERCEKLWQRRNLDAKAGEIIAALELAKRSSQWKSEGGRYIPKPLKWLRNEAWEAHRPKPPKPPAIVAPPTVDPAAALRAEQKRRAIPIWQAMTLGQQRELIEAKAENEFIRAFELKRLPAAEPTDAMTPHVLLWGKSNAREVAHV
jgi:hypothetical protein